MNMEQPFPYPLLWGAMVGVGLFASVVVAEEGGRHSRPDANSAEERQPGWIPPTRGLPGTPSTGFTREKPIMSPAPGFHETPEEASPNSTTPAEEGAIGSPGPTTGPSSSSLPADFGASLTRPGIGATPPRSSQVPRAEFKAGMEGAADDGKGTEKDSPGAK